MYTEEKKKEMISIFQELEISREVVINFLKISKSTYDKMTSSQNRPLPKRSQLYLERIFNTEDWDEILEQLKTKKEFIQKNAKINHLHKSEKIHLIVENIDLFQHIVENEEFAKYTEEDKKELLDLLNKKYFYKVVSKMLRVKKFYQTGNKKYLKKKDNIYIGYIKESCSYLKNKENQKKSKNLENLEEIGKEEIKKVEDKFKNNDIFEFIEGE